MTKYRYIVTIWVKHIPPISSVLQRRSWIWFLLLAAIMGNATATTPLSRGWGACASDATPCLRPCCADQTPTSVETTRGVQVGLWDEEAVDVSQLRKRAKSIVKIQASVRGIQSRSRTAELRQSEHSALDLQDFLTHIQRLSKRLLRRGG